MNRRMGENVPTKMTWDHAQQLADRIAQNIATDYCRGYVPEGQLKVWGIPRGGGYVAALLNGKVKNGSIFLAVENPEDAIVAVDDIIDTGNTAAGILSGYGLKTYALVDRVREGDRWTPDWIVFPWEGRSGQEDDKLSIVTRMLQAIGEDAKRDGLKDTPRRVVESWSEIFEGYNYTPGQLTGMLTRFPGPDNLVTVDGIPFTSTCEWDLIRYYGEVSIRYRPSGGVIGLHGFYGIVPILAHRVTNQQQLTQDILDVISPVVASAIVEISASHPPVARMSTKAVFVG